MNKPTLSLSLESSVEGEMGINYKNQDYLKKTYKIMCSEAKVQSAMFITDKSDLV